MTIERLKYEDGHVLEIMVDKMNEIIDAVNEMDERLTQRLDSHWKYHRIKQRESHDNTEKIKD